jgi:hypothetical protein
MAIQTEEYKGYVIAIENDPEPSDPREWDNMGVMRCWHNNHVLGDTPESYTKNYNPIQFLEFQVEAVRGFKRANQRYNNNEMTQKQYLETLLKLLEKNNVFLPLYLYDHSGLSISATLTYPFTDPWDAGQVGWIIASRDKILEFMRIKRLTAKARARISQVLMSEVETYNKYLQGDIYGYIIKDNNDKVIDSLWSIEDEEVAMTEAKSAIDYIVGDNTNER